MTLQPPPPPTVFLFLLLFFTPPLLLLFTLLIIFLSLFISLQFQCLLPKLTLAPALGLSIHFIFNFDVTTRDRRLCLKPALIEDTDYMVDKTYHLARCFHMPKQSLVRGAERGKDGRRFLQKKLSNNLYVCNLYL